MDHNPILLSPEQLQLATQTEIMQAQYQYIVAATSLAFTILFFYWGFRLMVWFLPDRWYAIKGRDRK